MSTSLLLTYLQNTNPNVSLETIVAALAHHLAVDLPTPTPLAASAISSPFFLTHPCMNEKLQGLVTSFRHAVHLKHQSLKKSTEDGWSLSRAIFSQSLEGGIREWVRGIVRGLQGGRAVIRLACCTGLLLGMNEISQIGVGDGKVEDEVIIALAEVMDDYNANTGDWEKEFQPKSDETSLSLTLILASQSLPLIPKAKLKALPLSLFAGFLTSTIASAFRNGTFLGEISDPSFGQTVESLSTSPTMVAMAGLSKLTALILGVSIESSTSGFQDAYITLQTFQITATRVERNWKDSNFASTEIQDELPPAVKEQHKRVWLLLKTLLFSTIMVADSILAAVVYARPTSSNGIALTHLHVLAKSILRILSHLSFVVSQFGGVTVTATSDDPGFVELRKVFYLALDVLSSQDPSGENQTVARDCEDFVRELVGADTFVPGVISRHTGTYELSKTAYALACIEQLVPSLGVSCLEDYVWRLCTPYLSDPSHRETYESAHSVVLAIFSSHVQQDRPGHSTWPSGSPAEYRRSTVTPEEEDGTRTSTSTQAALLDSTGFVHRMVPYYAQCLIENSQDGRLSTAQLRLAYAALIRSACSSRPNAEAFQLGWYCITLILDMIRTLSFERIQGNDPAIDVEERLHRLHLTLISTVSALPLPLMIRALDEIRNIITRHQQSDSGVGWVRNEVEEERKRKELVDALFAEILGKVGDQEKEVAMRWWYVYRETFLLGNGTCGADMDENRPRLAAHL